jgi:hypothetical protein
MLIIQNTEKGMLFILSGILRENDCPFGFDDIFIMIGLMMKKRKSIYSFISSIHYYIYLYSNENYQFSHKIKFTHYLLIIVMYLNIDIIYNSSICNHANIKIWRITMTMEVMESMSQ